ncbi:ABC transporter ATP-binding protein [Cupriavidus malaysiensis]|uniref:ABC transporter ATP-binding protein n=1 Tax=Cupriavidus malaysiensis TaxID=367825 RepID=A0ABM7DMK4_9BURK|nr:ABC transporter ATP-binding protein [Cupriavidus malaysiensis]AOZ09412.1 ABC transporter ATP-binding protein [Cupriavidus malaysiensis]
MSTVRLQAEGLALHYGTDRAPALFAGVGLTLRPGEIVSLIGPSGAGKSTLLRVLAGLQPATRGSVRLDGELLGGPHPGVAVAFQDPCLLPWLTVGQNAGFGLDFRHQPPSSRHERQARVAQMLDAVGLGHALHLFPAQLSGGMAQRVALARCLARQPRVLLLDEPFGALDEVTRAHMQALLRQLVGAGAGPRRPAVLLITHDLDEALLLSDRIVLLGGTPARIVQEWTVTLPHPREASVEALGELRVGLVKALRQAMPPRRAPSASPLTEPLEEHYVPGTDLAA